MQMNSVFPVSSCRGLCVLLLLTIAVVTNAQENSERQKALGSQYSERPDVRALGAIGDGQADDTDAIQRAVDSGIGDIRFPKGTYRLTRSVTIDLDRVGHVSLHGQGTAVVVMAAAGPAFKFVGTHEKSADPEGFDEAVWQRQRMPLVDGLAIVGEHAAAEGIEARGTMQLTITRVHCRKLLHAVHLTGNNRNLIIADCHFYQNRGCGVFYDHVNLHQSNITGCHISYNDAGGIVSRGGNVRNIHITGCDIESNMAVDGLPTANVLIDSANSVAGTGEVAITGCTIQHNNPSPNSANIRIIGRSAATNTQAIVREGNVAITGNVLSDVQVNIHLRECRGVTITGNTFWQGYRHNLLIEDSTAVVIGANNLDRNPRYTSNNSRAAMNSVVLRGCNDCLVTGLLVSNVHDEQGGLSLESCHRCSVSQCMIVDCDYLGLSLKNSEYCQVTNCCIRDDREGLKSESLRIEGGRGNIIANNVLSTLANVSNTQCVLRDNDIVPAAHVNKK